VHQVRHRNLSLYNRLLTLLKDHSRRFFLFSNEHNRETYTSHRPGESPNDRNDRAIRLSTLWYAKHLGKQYKVRVRGLTLH
jgi:exosome complex exonuclease DIS3/RRP44